MTGEWFPGGSEKYASFVDSLIGPLVNGAPTSPSLLLTTTMTTIMTKITTVMTTTITTTMPRTNWRDGIVVEVGECDSWWDYFERSLTKKREKPISIVYLQMIRIPKYVQLGFKR